MAGTTSLNRFYLILLVVAVVGGGLLFWQVRRGVPRCGRITTPSRMATTSPRILETSSYCDACASSAGVVGTVSGYP